MMVPVLPGEGPFGAVLAQDAVLLGAQFGASFGVGFGFIKAHGGSPVAEEFTARGKPLKQDHAAGKVSVCQVFWRASGRKHASNSVRSQPGAARG